MNIEEVRNITANANDNIPSQVQFYIELIEHQILTAAKLGLNYVSLTESIPCPYYPLERTAYFKAEKIIFDKGYTFQSNYLGKAYAINGNYYSSLVKW